VSVDGTCFDIDPSGQQRAQARLVGCVSRDGGTERVMAMRRA
jgi:hypothetical protein